MSTELD